MIDILKIAQEATEKRRIVKARRKDSKKPRILKKRVDPVQEAAKRVFSEMVLIELLYTQYIELKEANDELLNNDPSDGLMVKLIPVTPTEIRKDELLITDVDESLEKTINDELKELEEKMRDNFLRWNYNQKVLENKPIKIGVLSSKSTTTLSNLKQLIDEKEVEMKLFNKETSDIVNTFRLTFGRIMVRMALNKHIDELDNVITKVGTSQTYQIWLDKYIRIKKEIIDGFNEEGKLRKELTKLFEQNKKLAGKNNEIIVKRRKRKEKIKNLTNQLNLLKARKADKEDIRKKTEEINSTIKTNERLTVKEDNKIRQREKTTKSNETKIVDSAIPEKDATSKEYLKRFSEFDMNITKTIKNGIRKLDIIEDSKRKLDKLLIIKEVGIPNFDSDVQRLNKDKEEYKLFVLSIFSKIKKKKNLQVDSKESMSLSDEIDDDMQLLGSIARTGNKTAAEDLNQLGQRELKSLQEANVLTNTTINRESGKKADESLAFSKQRAKKGDEDLKSAKATANARSIRHILLWVLGIEVSLLSTATISLISLIVSGIGGLTFGSVLSWLGSYTVPYLLVGNVVIIGGIALTFISELIGFSFILELLVKVSGGVLKLDITRDIIISMTKGSLLGTTTAILLNADAIGFLKSGFNWVVNKLKRKRDITDVDDEEKKLKKKKPLIQLKYYNKIHEKYINNHGTIKQKMSSTRRTQTIVVSIPKRNELPKRKDLPERRPTWASRLAFPIWPPKIWPPVAWPPIFQKKTCRCPRIRRPVCGADGKTYHNACVARCKGVRIVRNGKCRIIAKPRPGIVVIGTPGMLTVPMVRPKTEPQRRPWYSPRPYPHPSRQWPPPFSSDLLRRGFGRLNRQKRRYEFPLDKKGMAVRASFVKLGDIKGESGRSRPNPPRRRTRGTETTDIGRRSKGRVGGNGDIIIIGGAPRDSRRGDEIMVLLRPGRGKRARRMRAKVGGTGDIIIVDSQSVLPTLKPTDEITVLLRGKKPREIVVVGAKTKEGRTIPGFGDGERGKGRSDSFFDIFTESKLVEQNGRRRRRRPTPRRPVIVRPRRRRRRIVRRRRPRRPVIVRPRRRRRRVVRRRPRRSRRPFIIRNRRRVYRRRPFWYRLFGPRWGGSIPLIAPEWWLPGLPYPLPLDLTLRPIWWLLYLRLLRRRRRFFARRRRRRRRRPRIIANDVDAVFNSISKLIDCGCSKNKNKIRNYGAGGSKTKFNLTIEKKTDEHPYFGKGSENGYAVNGTQGKTLLLKRGKKYTFQMKSVPETHPFYLATDTELGRVGEGEDAYFGDEVDGQFSVGTETLVFEPNDETPDTLYYQCGVHPYMGGKIEIKN